MLRRNGRSADELIRFLTERGFRSYLDDGQPIDRHDPKWLDSVNGIFFKHPEAERRLRESGLLRPAA